MCLNFPETLVTHYEGETKILSMFHLTCGTPEPGVHFKVFIR